MLTTTHIEQVQVVLADLQELRGKIESLQAEWQEQANEVGYVGNPWERRVSDAKGGLKLVTEIERLLVGAVS
jgi:hypothetical protein